MQRAFGISTHVISPGDVGSALAVLAPLRLPAVELRAGKDKDLIPLLKILGSLDLSGYTYVSFHAPSEFVDVPEQAAFELLDSSLPHGWPVIVHPDALARCPFWERLGERLCVENLDKRHNVGRTAAELEEVFARYPRASFCFDIGHARQVDPTMSEAALMLRRFRDRIKQVHISEVTSSSRHEGLTFSAVNSFRKVAHLLPAEVPVILETPVPADQLVIQLQLAEKALALDHHQPTHLPALNGSTKAAPLPTRCAAVKP